MNETTLVKIISTIFPKEHISSQTDEEIVIKKDQIKIKITPVSDIAQHCSGVVDDNSHIDVEISTPSAERFYTLYNLDFAKIINLIEERNSEVFSNELSSTFNLV